MIRHAHLTLAACLALSACVTINVYFPAAAAEKAADKLINEVWGEGQTTPKQDENKRGDLATPEAGPLLAAAGAVLEFIVPSAHAQASGANLNIDTPAVRQLTASMRARADQLKKYFETGAIGLTRDGLVQVRDQNLIPLPERNTVRKLVADENADRSNLYREIAAANGHPEWEADIRTTFAQGWVKNASAGWYFQDGSGAWKQK
jgi:uncharacterized protein